MAQSKKGLTTSAGAPVPDNQNSITVGARGPLVLQDVALIEKLAHQNRERVPERTVHAKGSGAFGTLTITGDIGKYTRAKFLQPGTKTDMLIRFSTVAGERGAADAERDVRGFAMKFYTDEGNFDLVGNNTPVFFVRDPFKFPDFIHTQKRDPRTNLRSPTAMWDFWSLSPESCHQVTILFSDRGLPASYRHMHGFGSHTYSLISSKGERHWVKFHFKTQQGIKNLTNDEGAELVGRTRESHQEDLYNSIEDKDFPKWRMYVQIMSEEQAAFNPNKSKVEVNHYHLDGAMRLDVPEYNHAYYEPNSFGGPAQQEQYREPPLKLDDATMDRFDHRQGNDDYRQAGDLFRLMDADKKRQLLDNIAEHMKGGNVPEEIVRRQIEVFMRCDPAYGGGLAERMGVKVYSDKYQSGSAHH